MPRTNPQADLLPGDCVNFTILGTHLSQTIEYTIAYVSNVGAGNMPNVLISFQAAWLALFQVDFLATFATLDVSWTTSRAQAPATVNIPTVVQNLPGGPLAGTVAGSSLNGMLSAVVTKYSPLKGQHGRGRIMHGPIPTSFTTPALDPYRVNAAGLAVYQTLYNQIMANAVVIAGQSFTPFILTRPVPPANQITRGAAWLRYVVEPVMGTVRRRREGRGS